MTSYVAAVPAASSASPKRPPKPSTCLARGDRVVGISGYTCRPPEAREKPKVSAFTSAKIDKILDLRPDLVIGFSDLQAAIAQDLIKAGVNVLVFNQRSVNEIFEMIAMLSRIVAPKPAGLTHLSDARRPRSHRRGRRPIPSPSPSLLRGVARPADQRHSLGGRTHRTGRRRARLPAIPRAAGRHRPHHHRGAIGGRQSRRIIASWCGRKVNKEEIRRRRTARSSGGAQQPHLRDQVRPTSCSPAPPRSPKASANSTPSWPASPEANPRRSGAARKMDPDLIVPRTSAPPVAGLTPTAWSGPGSPPAVLRRLQHIHDLPEQPRLHFIPLRASRDVPYLHFQATSTPAANPPPASPRTIASRTAA